MVKETARKPKRKERRAPALEPSRKEKRTVLRGFLVEEVVRRVMQIMRVAVTGYVRDLREKSEEGGTVNWCEPGNHAVEVQRPEGA